MIYLQVLEDELILLAWEKQQVFHLDIVSWYHRYSDRECSSIIDNYSFTYSSCGNHMRETSLKKGLKQNFIAQRYNLNKLVDDQTREEYQVDITEGPVSDIWTHEEW